MPKKIILIFILIILLLAGGIYYFFFYQSSPLSLIDTEETKTTGFSPINRASITTPRNTPISATSTDRSPNTFAQQTKLPALRHLSTTPIGGFMASSTASSTVVRFVDRGVGHIYESSSITDEIRKISNTTIPRVYESYWNKNLNTAVFRYMKDETDTISNFYAEIRPIKTSTSTFVTSNEINSEVKGKFISQDIKEMAVSPKKDRIFTLGVENGRGIGYVSGFDESKKTKIIDTPITQVSVEWPEENTVAITTKPSGVSSGYLYFLDIKKTSLKKILGGIIGLSTKVSPDAKKILFSSSNSRGFATNLYNTKDNSNQEMVFRTLADKCVWSRIRPNEIYCSVPVEIPKGVYPDDWYKGTVSFTDQIWHLDTTTGEVHLLANLLKISDELIDAIDLTLDPKENFLYFVNKRDLTLWSLDLND